MPSLLSNILEILRMTHMHTHNSFMYHFLIKYIVIGLHTDFDKPCHPILSVVIDKL